MADLTPEEVAQLGLIGRPEDVFSRNWTDDVLDILNDLAKQIRDNAPSDSGGLIQSIGVLPVEQTNTGFSFKLTMDAYGTYLDEGVHGNESSYSGIKHNRPGFKRGKRPPLSAVTNWSRDKGIPAYALRESIFKKGIRPRNFYSNVVNDSTIEDLNQEIAEITKGQILASIRASF